MPLNLVVALQNIYKRMLSENEVPVFYNCYLDLEEVANMNIEKLKARYPEGFEEEKSLNRKEGDI